MAQIRGIVFDLDGVLVDSTACHRAAFEEVFFSFGVRDFEYSRYAGRRTAEVVEAVLGPVDRGVVVEVSTRKSRLAREKLAAQPVDPVCLAVLNQLASVYVLALASSGSRESVEAFLDSNHCRHLFRSVLSGDSVLRAKPDPEIYQRSFSELEVFPEQGVVVEDAVAGIVAAKAARAAAVIGITGTCSAAELSDAGAAHVIERLADLPQLLSTRYGDQ